MKFFTEATETNKAGDFEAYILADTSLDADTEVHVLINGSPSANPLEKDTQISWYPNGVKVEFRT
jgi:hypothetical protein